MIKADSFCLISWSLHIIFLTHISFNSYNGEASVAQWLSQTLRKAKVMGSITGFTSLSDLFACVEAQRPSQQSFSHFGTEAFQVGRPHDGSSPYGFSC